PGPDRHAHVRQFPGGRRAARRVDVVLRVHGAGRIPGRRAGRTDRPGGAPGRVPHEPEQPDRIRPRRAGSGADPEAVRGGGRGPGRGRGVLRVLREDGRRPGDGILHTPRRPHLLESVRPRGIAPRIPGRLAAGAGRAASGAQPEERDDAGEGGGRGVAQGRRVATQVSRGGARREGAVVCVPGRAGDRGVPIGSEFHPDPVGRRPGAHRGPRRAQHPGARPDCILPRRGSRTDHRQRAGGRGGGDRGAGRVPGRAGGGFRRAAHPGMSHSGRPAATEVRGRLLARNTLLNLVGLGAPILVAVAAIPAVVRGLGEERFGILAIAWMVIAYLGELGVGRATTKFVAEALGAGDVRAAAETAWTATALQAIFGLVCGIGLAVATPFLVGGVLNIPPELGAEARAAFLWLAAGLPIVIVAAAWRGVLEAAQRFDLISAVRIPSTIANYVLPLGAVAVGWALPGVMALLVAARAGTLAALWALAYRAVPALRQGPALARGRLRALAGYGGWVSLSSVVAPALVYLDRFVLGVLASMSAVAYYAAPYEVVNRLAILPASVVGALFPALSALGGQAQWERIRRLASLSVKVILLLVAPFAVLL